MAIQFAQESLFPYIVVYRRIDIGIKVTIRAFCFTKWPMDIKTKPAMVPIFHHVRQPDTSFLKASAR